MTYAVRLAVSVIVLILLAPMWLLGLGFSGGVNWLVVLLFFPMIGAPLALIALSLFDWRKSRRIERSEGR